jgi:hypothetical protein
MNQTSGSSSLQAGSSAQQVQDMEARKAKYEHAIAEMEKHLSVESDGTIVLKVKSAAEIHVDPSAFGELSKSLQKANARLRADHLHPTQVRLTTDFGPSVAQMSPHLTAAGRCAGNDYTYHYWWGFRADIDECLTQKMIALLQVDAGVAAIGALVFAAVGVGILMAFVGAVEAIGQGIMQYYDEQCGHNGIAIYVTYFSVVPWVGCQ